MRPPARDTGSLRGLGAAAWHGWPQAGDAQASEPRLRLPLCQLVWWRQDLCLTAEPVAQREGSVSGRAAGPSELVVSREGPCEGSPGAALLENKRLNTPGVEEKAKSTCCLQPVRRCTRLWAPNQGMGAVCAAAPGGLSCSDGSVCPASRHGHPKVSVEQALPLLCRQPPCTVP